MKEKRLLLWVLGFLLTVFFTLRFIILYGKTQLKKPLLTITFDGIIDSSTSSIGYIPFKDIKNFIIISIMEEDVIGIIPEVEEEFIKKLSPTKQEIAKMNIRVNNPPLTISVKKAKDMSLQDIFTLLQKRLRDYNSLYK